MDVTARGGGVELASETKTHRKKRNNMVYCFLLRNMVEEQKMIEKERKSGSLEVIKNFAYQWVCKEKHTFLDGTRLIPT